jgi:hypothetical protein
MVKFLIFIFGFNPKQVPFQEKECDQVFYNTLAQPIHLALSTKNLMNAVVPWKTITRKRLARTGRPHLNKKGGVCGMKELILVLSLAVAIIRYLFS